MSNKNINIINSIKLETYPLSRLFCNYDEKMLENPVVYRCCTLAAQNISSLPLKIKNGGLLEEYLKQPNSDESYSHFIQKLVIYLLIYGSAYIMISCDKNQRIQFYVLNPNQVSIDLNNCGEKIGYKYQSIDGIKKIPKGNDDTFCPIIELCYNYTKLGPAKVAKTQIDTYNQIVSSNLAYIEKTPRLGGFIFAERVGSADYVNQLKEELDRISQLPGYIPIIQGQNLRWENKEDKKECSYLECLKIAEEAILDVFGVPKILVSTSVSATGGYVEARKHYWQDILRPFANNIIEHFELWLKKLYPEIDMYFDYSKIPAFVNYTTQMIDAVKSADFLSNQQKLEICGLYESE